MFGMRNAIRLLVSLLLIAAMVLPAAGNNVLCIGSDGHSAIELVHPNGGCEEVEGENPASDGLFVEVASGDCVDLPLATVKWMPRPEQEQQHLNAIAIDLLSPIYLIDLASEAPNPLHLSRWPDQDGVPELRRSLRSTVLLL